MTLPTTDIGREAFDTFYPAWPLSNPDNPPIAGATTGPMLKTGVMDQSTLQTIEVDLLFDSVNSTSTRAGQSALYASLINPPDSLELSLHRQHAIQELENTPDLRQSIESMIATASSQEQSFYDLLHGVFLGLFGSPAHRNEFEGFGYQQYTQGTAFILNLVQCANVTSEPESPYLNFLVGSIRNLKSSRAFALAQGPAYRTEKGMLTASEKPWWMPAVRFRPTLFKPTWLLAGFTLLIAALQFVPLLLDLVSSITPVFWLFLMPLTLLYIPLVGNFDRDGCIYPLRDSFKRSPELQRALHSLGQLDELMALIRFRESFGHPMVLPELVSSKRHTLKLKGVRNPVLAKESPDYVPNGIELSKDRLALITGPNSGGKTAFCKTLAQVQLLAQLGSYIPADAAKLSIADHIFYQVPEISQLQDGEGRFGTELRRTKEIFMAASPRSLVIMDELSEGTTHQEKVDISLSILDGFYRKGNTTLLITHNHELVDACLEKTMGLAKQVEFKDEHPTYRIVPGISRISHADRVARKIGFAKDDIDRMLQTD